jgi:hypothetical protein
MSAAYAVLILPFAWLLGCHRAERRSPAAAGARAGGDGHDHRPYGLPGQRGHPPRLATARRLCRAHERARVPPRSRASSGTSRRSGPYEPEHGDGFQIAEIGPDGWVRFTSTLDGRHALGAVISWGSAAAAPAGWCSASTRRRDRGARPWPGSTSRKTRRLARLRLNEALTPIPAGAGRVPVRGGRADVDAHDRDGDQRALRPANHRQGRRAGAQLSRAGATACCAGRPGAARRPRSPNLAERCGPLAFSDPPAAGWHLRDCRTYTNVVTE